MNKQNKTIKSVIFYEHILEAELKRNVYMNIKVTKGNIYMNKWNKPNQTVILYKHAKQPESKSNVCMNIYKVGTKR